MSVWSAAQGRDTAVRTFYVLACRRLFVNIQSNTVTVYGFIINFFYEFIYFSNSFSSDGSYYLSIPYALVNCPLHILIIMLLFNIVAIYKDYSLNKRIIETYRSSITGKWTIDPLNEVPDDQLVKGQCSADTIVHVLVRPSDGLFINLLRT